MKTKYWLWIGLMCGIISVPIYLFKGTDGNLADAINYFYLPTTMYVLSGPGMILGTMPILGQIIVVILNGFAYGALIGWIYGKIKNRNKGI
ncbi:hypothetical protein A2917_00170 [Candidatus Nomurabacteria bacterium RIFCSPLOWO2_01_FULL_42_17]|uniref:Uncharacterized protein n=1 Tax=Candidatus Nomurabacteria bacterium RIFCSPLOWO2_01_FULL_42_17 TaxID=1801780 RepID=A0A1F6XNL6_9BACT|nr:MAG: hypothetical protein A2917_00170 [Candidatus Nomurabacteria bacterium RIFCSPLOWO2_01_FULL_42_17]